MTTPIQNRLEVFRQQRRVQAGSLIITVFGDSILPRGGRVWLGSLIRLLEPLGLNERLIRTSVFRLIKEEWLATETMGRRADYILSKSGRRLVEEASRHIYASYAPLWDRRWRFVLIVGDLDAKLAERLRKAFFWHGFGALGSECFVHPSANLPAVFDALIADDLGAALNSLLPMLAAEAPSAFSASDADLVKRAWNLQGLAKSYVDFVATYQPILNSLLSELEVVSDEDAFLLRTLLIHDYRRLLLRDPELPEVLLSPKWPGQQARLLCRELYSRLDTQTARHLDEHLTLADGSIPIEDKTQPSRFSQHDPLAG